MRRLGVDPGSVRTGLSVSEAGLSVAVPRATLRHKTAREAVKAVAVVASEVEAQEIVVGLPLRLDGSEGEAARRSRLFASALEAATRRPVVLWDERLSTAQADRALTVQGVRGKARKDVVDQAAATLLLQSYLDAQENATWQAGPSTIDPNAQPDAQMETPYWEESMAELNLPPARVPKRRNKRGGRRSES